MEFLWTGWTPIVHSAIIVVAGYAVLIVLLRITGARTMAKMTPLDFVVALLIGIQWLLAVGRTRWAWVRKAVDNPPVLLWYDGVMITDSLRRHRLTEVDVHTAARQAGHGSLEHLRAVVMQQDGMLGVISKNTHGDGSTILPYVEKPPKHTETPDAPQ